MGKVWNYVFISVGLMIALEITGLQDSTTLFQSIGAVVEANGFSKITVAGGGIWDFILGSTGILTGALVGTGAAIVAGLFTKAKPENLILLPLITSVFGLFIQVFASLMNNAITTGQTWFSSIMILIFLPFSVGFVISLAEFLRGTD